MKKQSGVTLMYLAITIIIMIILATITISTSMTSFKEMRYETFMAELEEINQAVNETCESYLLAKENNENISSYEEYFEETFGSSPALAGNSTTLEGVAELIASYASLSVNNENLFYFSKDDIKTYFGLEVMNEAVLIDFSTRYVYSVEGCEDPNDSSKIYYTLSEMIGETNIYADDTITSSTTGVEATDDNSGVLRVSGDTKLLKVTLTLIRDNTDGIDYQIKKAYYSTDSGSTFVEVDYLGDCTYSDDSVSFVIYETGTYIFKVEDTSGVSVIVSKEYTEE